MAFGREVDDAAYILLPHEGEHGIEITDIGLDKAIVGLVFHIGEIGKIAGVGKLVDVDYPVFGIFVDKKPDDVAPDETCAPCDNDGPDTHIDCTFYTISVQS